MLAEAAEIEHTLMCSYLYAAFSLKGCGDEGLTTEQADAVERWRKSIMDVAIEEMGHLLIVANLTMAVGGRPHFARPNFPVSPGYFPAAVVVRLSGFCEQTLDHFIFLERPQGVEGEDADAFVEEAYCRSQARVGLMPAPQDYATIGHLYDAIRANIRALAGSLTEQGLFLSGTAGQLGADDIEMEGVDVIGDVATAMRGIDLVVEQGEGSPSDREDSHYRSFVAIKSELHELMAVDSAFAPAWSVVDDPVLRCPPEGSAACLIDDPAAIPLLDFACATYGLLLRTLTQCFGRTGSSARDDRSALLGVSFTLMHALAAAAGALAKCPAGASHPGLNAGMTFTMLRGVEPLLGGIVEQTIIRERLAGLADGSLKLAGHLSQNITTQLGSLARSFVLGQ
ncbi:ferritin-like domain-containing protein [Sphingomonas nostoxanthinifaciens]|uniref:ferritin-like domain-containing protein n=1 Tax=Sphingomonas nostoxanthinifaciens TaxID=2872652 RepID=UPI001CC21093|nr:ferritin-like protein [Sphingomonas nostoxanthinifaciens]UAK23830.1 ferritin-like protein [Sphingomonas nostoxanthinifaciens]